MTRQITNIGQLMETVARSCFYEIRENHFKRPWEEQPDKVKRKYYREAAAFIKQG